jgi:hypothetical protein
MQSRHMSEKWGATYPLATGDRLYAQDIVRDRRFFEENAGLLIQIMNKNFSDNLILSGLWCTQGAGHTMNVVAGKSLVKFNVTIPHRTTAWAIPPATETIDIMKIVEYAGGTNLSLAGIDTGGVTHNYAKLAFVETNGNTRARAKASGTYAYETYPDAVITFGTAAATAYETVIAEFTSNGATLTFINNGIRQFMGKGREDITIYTQADFNAVVERVSANRYQFKTGISSIFFKYLSGGYLMSGVLSGGDTWGNLETNGVTRWIMEGDASIYFADLQGYIKVVTEGCVLDGVYIKGLGSAAAGITASFYTAADRISYRNCRTSDRYTNVDYSAFYAGSLYGNTVYEGCKVSALKCNTAGKNIIAFNGVYNISNCRVSDINITNGNIILFNSCSLIKNISISTIQGIQAITCFLSCNSISNVIIYGITGIATQAVRGFDTCTNISSCYLDTFSTGVLIGFNSCIMLTGCNVTAFTGTATDVVKGFYGCTEISACRVYTLTTANAVCYGFDGCLRISACRAYACTSVTANQGSGFNACLNMTSCLADSNDLYGFLACHSMGFNKSTGNGTAYNTSYADAGAGNACADTAAGGYNS